MLKIIIKTGADGKRRIAYKQAHRVASKVGNEEQPVKESTTDPSGNCCKCQQQFLYFVALFLLLLLLCVACFFCTLFIVFYFVFVCV